MDRKRSLKKNHIIFFSIWVVAFNVLGNIIPIYVAARDNNKNIKPKNNQEFGLIIPSGKEKFTVMMDSAATYDNEEYVVATAPARNTIQNRTDLNRNNYNHTHTSSAEEWSGGYQIGSGHMWCRVQGQIGKETLFINDETLWTGTPINDSDPSPPAYPEANT